MEQELNQIIGELYTKLHRAQFVIIPQLQTASQEKDKVIAERDNTIRAFEVELAKHKTTLEGFIKEHRDQNQDQQVDE